MYRIKPPRESKDGHRETQLFHKQTDRQIDKEHKKVIAADRELL